MNIQMRNMQAKMQHYSEGRVAWQSAQNSQGNVSHYNSGGSNMQSQTIMPMIVDYGTGNGNVSRNMSNGATGQSSGTVSHS